MIALGSHQGGGVLISASAVPHNGVATTKWTFVAASTDLEIHQGDKNNYGSNKIASNDTTFRKFAAEEATCGVKPNTVKY